MKNAFMFVPLILFCLSCKITGESETQSIDDRFNRRNGDWFLLECTVTSVVASGPRLMEAEKELGTQKVVKGLTIKGFLNMRQQYRVVTMGEAEFNSNNDAVISFAPQVFSEVEFQSNKTSGQFMIRSRPGAEPNAKRFKTDLLFFRFRDSRLAGSPTTVADLDCVDRRNESL